MNDGFPRERLAERLEGLRREGVYLGTSSWKYPGWIGSVYDRERYVVRGRFSEARFRRDCLAEYAEVFPTVCVDAGYYQFPTPAGVEALMGAVPPHFRFGFKVTDAITVARFPKLERYGTRGGERNPEFLDASVFAERFLGPLAPHREKVGVVILEFGRFKPGEIVRGAEFVERLDRFLQATPSGWPLAVEVRNQSFLREEYFSVLRRHAVARLFNNWTRMPSVGTQAKVPGSRTADFLAARFLLTPGRTYADAVREFQPYEATAAVDGEARAAARELVAQARGGARPSFLYFNNRLEGNSPRTIAAVVAA